jgi:hypothetical protein
MKMGDPIFARDRRVDQAVDAMEKAKTKVERIGPSETKDS